jgi:hypothetical protein
MRTSTSATVATITEDFISPPNFCKTFHFAYSTLSARIRSGDIALHQFSDAARPKIDVAEALRVMSAIKRPYTAASLRLVRHDDDGTAAQPVKSDLFA